MKGVLDFLEKAGLVTTDRPAAVEAPDAPQAAGFGDPVPAWLPPVSRGGTSATSTSTSTPSTSTPSSPPAAGEAPRLQDIYDSEGVPPSLYPAERLLRLVDGLSAMDEATRHMALRAMDAADESWTIADPLADARAKVTALAHHVQRLRQDLLQTESDTQARLQAARTRQDEAAATIRKQIADMEALLARETARGQQESATEEAALQAVRDQTARQLADIEAASQRLQSLSTQFSSLAEPAKD